MPSLECACWRIARKVKWDFPITCGIDEAGRGPVIGPMAICLVGCSPGQLKELEALAVKDSKALSPSARETLFPEIKKVAIVETRMITADELNRRMGGENLNTIEMKAMAELIDRMAGERTVYIDSPDPNPLRCASRVLSYCAGKNVKIIAEHKADAKYPVVSAASICAKVQRDNEIEKIKKEIGYDFNSGYPSDPMTIGFLTKHMDDSNVKKYLRKKWKTLDKIRQKQKTLGEF